MSTTAGLLRPAIRWSWVGLGVGVAGTIAFWAWTLGIDEGTMPTRIHRGISTNLAVLVLGALAVQLTARVIVWLRHLQAQVDRLDGLFDDAMARVPQACNTQFLMIEERLERTVPLPRAVGAAHVPTAMAPVDADVIHIAKRVQDRLNGHGDDH